ncbi:MAG: hypothetical protein PHE17_01895 [Thiothrix sp.]|uniref:hypothetical protein n=1 Tax=Thiothrix sp. TaxID=1032 RepID=UPI002632D814|nr:hypothetical protein [Thiothrix sp.]MDD5391751.1 hypothetical protein [Thiothrix sp.]
MANDQSAFTQYAGYARSVAIAQANATAYRKYVEGPDSYPAKIQAIEASIAAEKAKPKPNPVLLQNLQANADKFKADYAKAGYAQKLADAIAAESNAKAEMLKLENANEVFQCTPMIAKESLYIVDTAGCNAFRTYSKSPLYPCYYQAPPANNAMQQKAIQQVQQPVVPQCVCFQNKTITLPPTAGGDGLRVWESNIRISKVNITDQRVYGNDVGHKDAIQLIPPAKTDPVNKAADGSPCRMEEQMAGAMLENIYIDNCQITAEKAAFQGIFASDGLFRNIRILNNTIKTQAAHFITLNGLLSGVMRGNKLVAAGTSPARVQLYSTRIGGSLAEEGLVWLLSFSASTGFQYAPLDTDLVFNKGKPEEGLYPLDSGGNIDHRGKISRHYAAFSIGLEQFDYYGYLREYNSLTYGQYRSKYPDDLKRMEGWLTARIAEYKILDPKSELRLVVMPQLQDALAKLHDPSLFDVRVPDLKLLPVKIFSMKRLAIRFGKLAVFDPNALATSPEALAQLKLRRSKLAFLV